MSLKSALRSLCLTERICSCVSAPNVVLGGGGLVVDDEDDAGDESVDEVVSGLDVVGFLNRLLLLCVSFSVSCDMPR